MAFAQPSWLWAEAADGPGTTVLHDLVVNKTTGEVYTVGQFTDDLSVPYPIGINNTPDLSSTYGPLDGLVAKYDSTGNVLWAFKIGAAAATTRIKDIALDAAGNLYIVGHFAGTCQFAGVSTSSATLLSAITEDVFLAKYDPNGNLQWVRQGSVPVQAIGEGICVVGNQVSLCGRYRGGTLQLQGGTNPNVSLAASGVQDHLFVASYNLNGDILWGTMANGDRDNTASSICSDGSNVFITGYFNSTTCNFNSGAITIANSANPNGEGLVASFAANTGVCNWAERFGGANNDYGRGIAVDGNGVFATGSLEGGGTASFTGLPAVTLGTFGEDVFTARFLKNNGQATWAHAEVNNGFSLGSGQDVSIDPMGNVLVTGFFDGATEFNNGLNPQFAIGGTDIFVLSRANGGAFNWVQTAGDASSEAANGIGFDNRGVIYSTGYYNGAAAFATTILPDRASSDGFVATLQFPCSAAFTYPDTAFCAADTNPLPLVTGDTAGTFTSGPGLIFADGVVSSSGEIDVVASTPGIYEVVYTAPLACADTFTVAIDAAPSPANAGLDQSLCGVTTGQLNGNTPLIGIGGWTSLGAATITNPASPVSSVTGLLGTANLFEWTISHGVCEASVDTVNLTIFPNLIIDLGNDTTLCLGDTLLLEATRLGGTYQWSNGETTPIVTITASAAISVIVTDANSCTGTDTLIATFVERAIADLGPDTTLCAGASLTLNGNPNGIANMSILWSSGSTQPTELVNTSGTYWLTTATACSQASDTLEVDVVPIPVVELGNDTILCAGDSLVLTADPLTAFPNATFEWSTGATGRILTVFSGGQLWVEASNIGCTYRDSLEVDQNIYNPTIFGLDSTYCALDAPVPLAGMPPGGTFSGTAVIGTDFRPDLAPQNTPISIQYQFVDGDGCIAEAEVEVTVFDTATANAGPDQELFFGSRCNLEGNSRTNFSGIWTRMSGSGSPETANSPNMEITGLSIGENRYRWTLGFGACQHSDEVLITRYDFNPERVFTPNGDGWNDTFEIPGLANYPQSIMEIFSRWGISLFKSADYQNDWAGKNKAGEDLPSDTYHYLLTLPDGEVIKGFIFLKREGAEP